MKASNYVTTAKRSNGELLVYSGTTGAVVNVSRENMGEWSRLGSGHVPSSASRLESWAYECVIAAFGTAGIVIEDGLDEERALEARYRRLQGGENVTTATVCIAPTMKCNLACPYCYNPKQDMQTMSNTVVADVVRYIRENIVFKLKPGQDLAITWIGGEPLYDKDVLVKLATGISEAARDTTHRVRFHVVTNGTLLDAESVELLKRPPLAIEQIQVTLDGPPYLHDKLRVTHTGMGTFALICENIRRARDVFNVSIRIGVSRTFTEGDFVALADELIQRGMFQGQREASIFMARICPCKNDRTSAAEAMAMAEFSRLELNCAHIARDRGIPFRLDTGDFIPSGPCNVTLDGTMAIDPHGRIFKCMESMGKSDEAIGSVSRGIGQSRDKGTHIQWVSYDPHMARGQQCASCKVYPLCYGGCPRARIHGGEAQCTPVKYNLKERLLFKYDRVAGEDNGNRTDESQKRDQPGTPAGLAGVRLWNLVFLYTRRCTYSCEHCSVGCGPEQQGKLDPEWVTSWIEQAVPLGIQHLDFTGGEPFIYYDEILSLAQKANKLGLKFSITTNGYWADSQQEAMSRVRAMKEAGLNALMISYDEYHAKSGASFAYVENVVRACASTGTPVFVNYVRDSSWDPNVAVSDYRLRRLKDTYPCTTVASSAVPYGNASRRLFQQGRYFRKIPADELLGCQEIGALTCMWNGDVYPCCGHVVCGACSEGKRLDLLYMGNVQSDTITRCLERVKGNLFLKAVAILGPSGFKALFEEMGFSPEVPGEMYHRCDLCQCVSGNADIRKWLRGLEERREELDLQLAHANDILRRWGLSKVQIVG